MKPTPLRYRISSWRQLPQCKSNNSRYLYIHVADFFGNDRLQGFRIAVNHSEYGTLFACILNARGTIVSRVNSDSPLDDPIAYELSTDEILKELEKYGFLIDFDPRQNLPGDQLDYLITLQKLHFDKIRVLPVWSIKHATKQVKVELVAFNCEDHVQWLNNDYSPSDKEFVTALMDGTAINLTDISKTRKFQWDWLDYVANIDDIIRDNAGDGIYGG